MVNIAKIRPRSEVIMLLIQPIANCGVRLLARWWVNPLWIVLGHALLGFFAALLIWQGWFWLAAMLLQLKTLLDNMDGGLARATQQITLMGRYFDTGMDFLVNIALFVALSSYGADGLSLLAFILLTLILSLDFNAERFYKQAHLPAAEDAPYPVGAPIFIYRIFKGLYDLLFAPQDRLIQKLDTSLFKYISHTDYSKTTPDIQQHWSNLFSTAAIVNLGLSTQMFMLGLCCVLGRPFWYVYSVFIQTAYVVIIQIIRVLRLRNYLGVRGQGSGVRD